MTTQAEVTVYAAERIINELQDAWRQPNAGHRRFNSAGSPPFCPIAGGAEDQAVPEGVQNPYWDVVRWMAAEPPWSGGLLEPTFAYNAFGVGIARRLEEIGAGRHHLAARYAWSIVSPGDVQWMTGLLDGRAVVEIGAGTGYWAWQLEQAGTDVAAYDPNPPAADNRYCKGGPYTTVLADDATAVRHHQDRALLMVWPPYEGEHARHALSLYTGDLLLYAGEGEGGCTADDGFYSLLAAEWDEVSVAPQHVTWWGIHCRLAAYRRKAGERS